MEGLDSGRGMAGDSGIANGCFRCPMVMKPFCGGKRKRGKEGETAPFSQEVSLGRKIPDANLETQMRRGKEEKSDGGGAKQNKKSGGGKEERREGKVRVADFGDRIDYLDY